MTGPRRLAAGLLVLASGCHSGPTPRSVASAEPPLTKSSEPGVTVVETLPPKTVTWADRHPLFTKPREYYASSGDNRIVKATAATVVGIPAGIYGELKQIVVGRPADAKF